MKTQSSIHLSSRVHANHWRRVGDDLSLALRELEQAPARGGFVARLNGQLEVGTVVSGLAREQTVVERAQARIVDRIRELQRSKPETLVQRRYEKLRRIGAVAWHPPEPGEPVTVDE